MRRTRTPLVLAIAIVSVTTHCMSVPAQTLSLHGTADETSSYYEYYSDAFMRMSLRDPPPNEFRQRFHSPIVNPTTTFGNLDGFPNENDFRLGQIEFDATGLVDGSGVAPITGLLLGVRTDPLDTHYENWRRATFETRVDGLSGSISVVQGVAAGVYLDSQIAMLGSNFLNNANPPVMSEYLGSFTVRGNRFQILVDDDPIYATIFTTDQPVRLAWDFTGEITAVPSIGDFDNDGTYDCHDVDSLVAAIASGTYVAAQDLNQDGVVNTSDLTLWLQQAGVVKMGAPFLPGDADLDGLVDGTDFGIWNGHKFTAEAAWCSGDFDADGVIDGSDFGVWNAHRFQSSDGSAAAVPEPAAGGFVLMGIMVWRWRHWRKSRARV